MTHRSARPARLLLTLLIPCFFVGCAGSSGVLPISGDALSGLSDQGTIAGLRMRMEVSLWRDFMPGPGVSDGDGLSASIQVLPVDDAASIPAGVRPTRLWVVDGDRVWGPVELRSEEQRNPEEGVRAVAREGPAWPAEIRVTVLVEVEDPGGENLLLVSRNVRIEAVYADPDSAP